MFSPRISIRACQLALLSAAISFGLFRSTLRDWLKHGPDADQYRKPQHGILVEIYSPDPSMRPPPVIEEHRGCVTAGWRSFDRAQQPHFPPLRDLRIHPAIAP